MTTQESNKLIAVSREDATLLSRFTGNLNYILCERDGLDWNGLMPVVIKIINLPLDKWHPCRDSQRGLEEKYLTDALYKDNLYKAVVEFIKWWNDEKRN